MLHRTARARSSSLKQSLLSPSEGASEIVDPPPLGHPPDPVTPFACSATGCPRGRRGPVATTPLHLTAFASPPMTHIHALLHDDTPVTNGDPSAYWPPCPFPLSFSFLPRDSHPRFSLEQTIPVPSTPSILPLNVCRRALFVPSRSRLRFFGSRTVDPLDPPARTQPRDPAVPRATTDSHARFVHVPMRGCKPVTRFWIG